MNTSRPFTREDILDMIKHDAIVSLYHNPLLREKRNEIAGTYSYLYQKDIDSDKAPRPLVVLNPERVSVYSQVAYDVVQSFGLNFFTNPDLKTKEMSDVLIQFIKCDHSSATEKLKALGNMRENAAFVSFENLDNAAPQLLIEIKAFIETRPENMFLGFEAQTPTSNLSELLTLQVTPVKKPKMK